MPLFNMYPFLRLIYPLSLALCRQSRVQRRAFTLVELLTVVGIIAVLSALLFPAFFTVRGKARQTSCLSNLRQIGTSVGMYLQDYDSKYPYAVDPSDKVRPDTWGSVPAFMAQIPSMPYLQDVMQPYSKSKSLFACPADTGFDISDFTGVELNAFPTSFEKYGTSYYYRTELAFKVATEGRIAEPERFNLIFDGAGRWHGTLVPPRRRYNVLFGDLHVKNINAAQMDEAWSQPLD